tara:strand:+ start:191962 stop:192195 length:234 start_codon:yes stop_codon:yes gene_type:complete
MGLTLEGKTALVTGAGSGLGAAISDTLAEAGLTVAVTDMDQDSVDAKVKDITDKGGKALPFILDVTDPEAFEKPLPM